MNHSSRDYEAELRALREAILEIGGRIEEMIQQAMVALIDRDSALARRTIAADNQVNQLEIDTDGLCLRILARRQPMASDLRFITIALKMVTDLERIGDLAVNVCERALDLNTQPALKPYEDMQRMADIAREMVSEAIEAFIAGDPERARKVIERDDEVDGLYHSVFRDILELMLADSSVVERGIHIQSTAKFLERIGDHATNLAEQVIFMVNARDIRHTGKLPGAG